MSASQTPDLAKVDLRCPIGPRKLLGVIRAEGGHARMADGNLLELSCRDCTSLVRKAGRPGKVRVLHRFNLLGELVESVEERF